MNEMCGQEWAGGFEDFRVSVARDLGRARKE